MTFLAGLLIGIVIGIVLTCVGAYLYLRYRIHIME